MLTMEPRCFLSVGSSLLSRVMGKDLLSAWWKLGRVIDLERALTGWCTLMVFGMKFGSMYST